jgi:hypothetical protein
MSSEFLPVFVSNALGEAAERVPVIAAGRGTLDEALALCRCFRVAGIGSLFLEGDGAELQLRLSMSGHAWATWLAAAPDEAKVTGLGLPFLDAVAAGDLDCAAEIARRSRHTWARGEEYEEDFLFHEFLMRRFFLDAPPAELEALLARWKVALQGSDDPRLDACRALQDRDAPGFGRALAAYLAERADDLSEAAEGGGLAPELAATEGELSVEGVALARLADRVGLATAEDYPRVPSVAREPPARPFEPDAWKKVLP